MSEGLAKEPTSGNPVKSSDCLITPKKWIGSMMLNQWALEPYYGIYEQMIIVKDM